MNDSTPTAEAAIRWWSSAAARRSTAVVAAALTVPAVWVSIAASPWLLANPVFCVVWLSTGLFLWSRRPENSVGPMMALLALLFLIGASGVPYGGIPGVPPLLEPRAGPLILANAVLAPSAILFVIPLMIFPDGHLPRPGWRWIPAALVMLAVIGFGAGLLATPGPGLSHPVASKSVAAIARTVMEALFGVLELGLIGVFVSVRLRYKSGSEAVRHQLKWLLAAIAVYLLFQTIGQVQRVVVGIEAWNRVGFALDSLLGSLIPVAIMVAVLKYRLYDIDRIISRTVTYVLVAGVVAAIYATPVIVLPSLVGAGNDLVVAGSTLAAAAIFNPVRRRIQSAVDKRFNRARFDGEQLLSELSDRLRNLTDVEDLSNDLRLALDRTLSPVTTTLWIRSS